MQRRETAGVPFEMEDIGILSILVVAGACASAPHAPAPVRAPDPATAAAASGTVANPAPLAFDVPADAQPPPPSPAPAPIPPSLPKLPVYERLRDTAGAVAGLEGWMLQRKPDATHCGGLKIVTLRGKRELSADEQPLAAVLALTFPTNLAFPSGAANRKINDASLKRFNKFVREMIKVGQLANEYYKQSIVDHPGNAEEKIHALARIAQVNLRLSSLLARGQIPRDVRTGEFATEKTAAFCDKMLEVAEPLLDRAEEAIVDCASMSAASTGWWTPVCTSART